MALSDQYIDSFSDDDSQDDSYSDYSSKTTRKRASTTSKKSNKLKATTTPKRPGRKPIEKSMDEELAGGDPKLKRKAQNRAAQRAFRNRKEKFVSELQERIRHLEEEKSSKETDLELENAKLKEEVDKLRQENYSLKDTKFTFEYPSINSNDDDNNNNNNSSSNSSNDTSLNDSNKVDSLSNAHPLDSPPLTSTTLSITEDYNSINNNNSDNTLEPSLSLSPNKHININNSNSSGKDTINSSSSGSERNSPSSNINLKYENSINQLSNANVSINNQNSVAPFGLLNDLQTNYVDVLPPPSNPNNSDLFHGKIDFAFSNYRNPVTAADDWLLRENTNLPPLFGVDADRYGFNQPSLPPPPPPPSSGESIPSFYNSDNINMDSMNNFNNIYNTIYSSINTMPNPSYSQPRQSNYYNDPELTPCKAKVIATIRLAKEQGKTRLQVKNAVKISCPGFNVDILCGELRKMTVGYDSSQPFNDTDLAIVTHCVTKLV